MGQTVTYCRLILLPSLVGLFCYACSQTIPNDRSQNNRVSPESVIASPHPTSASGTLESAPNTTNSTGRQLRASHEKASEVDTKKASKPQSRASSANFQEGVNLASSAYLLSQSAISPDDWKLVVSKWERAIEQLNQVSDRSDQYDTAQAKIEEYTRNAKYSISQIEALQAFAKVSPIIQQSSVPNRRSALPTERSPSTSDFPAASQPPPAASQSQILPQVRNKEVIPIVRRLHGTPIVRVTFNDSKTYDMILDTGASRTLITRAMANELDVTATERMIAATASASEVVFELGRVKSISMGSLTLNNARVSIGDSIAVGLLGNDFLSGYDITIRSRENVVELVRS